jgi:hypothetical protein
VFETAGRYAGDPPDTGLSKVFIVSSFEIV